jgi:TolB-like protein
MKRGMKSSVKAGPAARLGSFLEEVGRRRVWRSALGYAAMVFVLLQLGEIVFPAFGAPEWALRFLVVASCLGFPVTLALAWAFDLTPDGIQKAQAGEVPGGREAYSGTTLPRLALLGVTVTVVGGLGWWTVRDTMAAATPVPASTSGEYLTPVSLDEALLQVRSLAVLPLEDFSQEEGGEYFTAGLHEELISQLSQIGAARVLSRTTVVQYDRAGKTMPVLANELGVEGVVEGSVFRDGNRVRITVQLIHGPTDQHLWANSYEGTLEDAIALQRTVAQAIAKEIRAELFPQEEAEPLSRVRVAASPGAQEEYLRGRYEQSKGTPEAIASAIDHYESAVQEDSGFAPAYVGLAAARFLQDSGSEDPEAPEAPVAQEVLAPLARALRLDGRSPEARALLLAMRGSLGELPEGALPEGLSIILDSVGLLEAEVDFVSTEFGRQLQEVIQKRAPGIVTRGTPVERLTNARRLQSTANYDEAERLVRSTVEEAPGSLEAWEALEHLKALQGDFQGALEVRKEWMAQNPGGAEAEASIRELERHLADAGETGYWSWRVDDLKAREEKGVNVSSVDVARALVGVGKHEEAFAHLERALAERDRNLVSLWTDPTWDPLRADPRFREILTEVRRRRESSGTLHR